MQIKNYTFHWNKNLLNILFYFRQLLILQNWFLSIVFYNLFFIIDCFIIINILLVCHLVIDEVISWVLAHPWFSIILLETIVLLELTNLLLDGSAFLLVFWCSQWFVLIPHTRTWQYFTMPLGKAFSCNDIWIALPYVLYLGHKNAQNIQFIQFLYDLNCQDCQAFLYRFD